MAEIDDGAALTALKDWSNAVGSYWSYFHVVGLGAIGFAINMGKDGAATPTRLLLALGFVLFAAGNLTALLRRQEMFVALAQAMQLRAATGAISPPEYRTVFLSAKAYPVERVAQFHIGITVLIALVIWFASGSYGPP